jgi:DNA-binding LacI/PurR family transcriptional regulator
MSAADQKPRPASGRSAAPVRLSDIARAAGVSVSTVSRALRGAEGVGEELRRRITGLAAEYGYETATVERKLFTVVPFGLLSDDPAGFYGEILEAIEAEFTRLGVVSEVIFLRPGEEDARQILESAAGFAEAGAVLIGVDDRAALTQLAGRMPAVLVNGDDAEMKLDTVSPNYRYGARAATRYLIDQGCRRIGHVTWLKRVTFFDRLAGYRQALEAEGMTFEADLVVETDHMTPELARRAVDAALNAGRLRNIDGLFCGNDLAAIGAIEAFAAHGIAVPDDVRVVGFDNTRMTARFRPGLTTIAVDLEALGRRAARQLLARLDGGDGPAVELALGCGLIRRDTA